jgi:flagellar hook assembly protein FlgD
MADALDALRLDNQPAAKPAADGGLGRDAFLKIFLAQLETQDPLNPQDATALSSQLAQFSQLEQSLQSTNAIEALGKKLDTLIELSGGGGTRLDPVSLIGREVEFEGKSLAVTPSGDAPAVAGEVTSTTRQMVFTVKDQRTGALGLAILAAPADENGQPRNLPSGTYRLRIENGEAVLNAPTPGDDPIEGTLEFRRAVRLPDGTLVPDEDGAPFKFVNGATYDVEVVSLSPSQVRTDVSLRRSGMVSSVRIEDGTPILKVDGADVDITTIQQIR